jgi:hypothetical protein
MAAAPARRQAAKPVLKKKARDFADINLVQRWTKPLSVAAASVAGMAALYLFVSGGASGQARRVAVFPAQGLASYEGKPLASASIFLHPIGVKEPVFPLPRATANADGSYVIGTYGRDDGAPAGEYQITVQWFAKVNDPEKNDSIVPRNQAPARYARAETSGLSALIQEGDNKIPALQLRR